MNDFISNAKKALITSAVYAGEREDGRDLFSFRNIQIQFSTDFCSAEVNLGKTKVVCRLEATITEPRPDKQSEGFLVIRVDLSALQSVYTHRQVREKSEEVSKVLEKTIKGSK
jgi:exosome complex component RRP45